MPCANTRVIVYLRAFNVQVQMHGHTHALVYVYVIVDMTVQAYGICIYSPPRVIKYLTHPPRPINWIVSISGDICSIWDFGAIYQTIYENPRIISDKSIRTTMN